MYFLFNMGIFQPATRMSQEVSKWLVNGLFHLLINGVYGGYNPLTNHLLTSWDIQVCDRLPEGKGHKFSART